MYNLNTNLSERIALVNSNPPTTPAQAEQAANYLLYGKDSNGLSAVDRKLVYLKPKHDYSKNAPLSLDELTDSPTFIETPSTFSHTKYRVPKPSFSREDQTNANLPNINDLWHSIDAVQAVLEKTDPTSKKYYEFKHLLVELRKDQYLLRDQVKSPITKKPDHASAWEPQTSAVDTWPLSNSIPGVLENPFHNGVVVDIPLDPPRNTIDLTNWKHIAQIGFGYWELRDENKPLIDQFDRYVEMANFSEQQTIIWNGKLAGKSNLEILADLEASGYSHAPNYISTIWTTCCKKVAAQADLVYDEWCCKDWDKAWKRCSCCGEWKMRDRRLWHKKKKNIDGWANVCKDCVEEKKKNK